MARTTKPLLFLLFLLLVVPQSLAWYSTSWSYRKTITIDANQVNGTNTNFPLLVSTSGDASLAAHALANGNDLLFTNSADVKLPHEVESYNSTSGQLVAWVQVANLANTSNTTLYLYYGNSGASNQQNATGVWDTTYLAVYHFSNGTGLSLNDSTSNHYGLTNHNSVSTTAGPLGGAAGKFDGSSQYLSNGAIATPNSITVSFWNNVAAADVQNAGAFDFGGSSSPRLSSHTPWSDQNLYWDYYDATTNSGRVSTSYWNYLNGWSYVTLVYDNSNGNHSIYLNGSSIISNIHSSANPGLTGLDIGQAIGNWHKGSLDEFRVSNTPRSGQWLMTEFNNQKPGSTMVTLGSEQSAWYNASWPYRKAITVDASQVNGSNANFPLLVRLTSDADLAARAQSSGNDLVFAAGATKLPSEIESYNSTTGSLIAWVQVPSVTNTSNTTLALLCTAFLRERLAEGRRTFLLLRDGSFATPSRANWALPVTTENRKEHVR